MITLTGRDTCRPVHIDDEHIEKIEELTEFTPKRAYPYTRVFIKDTREKHEYFLDVIESPWKINQIIEEKREKDKLKPKKGANNNETNL